MPSSYIKKKRQTKIKKNKTIIPNKTLIRTHEKGLNKEAQKKKNRKMVMRGLDPHIHSSTGANGKMDRRVKPGDDNIPSTFPSLCLCGESSFVPRCHRGSGPPNL